jgi:hypothetical protein
MAEPMGVERFIDRWQNYRSQPQQIAAIKLLHTAIASLEGGQTILDGQAPWAREFSKQLTPLKPKPLPLQPAAGTVSLTLPFFDQTNDGPDGWRHCQSSSIAMNLAYLGVAGIKDDLDYLKVVQRHGDTTQQAAHAAALAELKAPGRFMTSCSVERATMDSPFSAGFEGGEAGAGRSAGFSTGFSAGFGCGNSAAFWGAGGAATGAAGTAGAARRWAALGRRGLVRLLHRQVGGPR